MAKHTFTPFPLYEISGPPFERGLQYGEQAKEKIITSVGIYTDSLKHLGLSKEIIGKLSEKFLPKIKKWAPDLFEEMKGVAKGASLSLSEIVMINARTEIMQLAERNEALVDQKMDGCTGAIIMPKLSANNEIIHGQNPLVVPKGGRRAFENPIERHRPETARPTAGVNGNTKNHGGAEEVGDTIRRTEKDRERERGGGRTGHEGECKIKSGGVI